VAIERPPGGRSGGNQRGLSKRRRDHATCRRDQVVDRQVLGPSADQDVHRRMAAGDHRFLRKQRARPSVYIRRRRLAELGLWIGLVGLAIAGRYILLDVESRIQILCLWLVAATVEWPVKAALGFRSRIGSFLSVCAMIAIAVIATRGFIKGLCPHTWPNCSFHEPTKLLQAILAG
jgi:hypothetical protein